MHEQVAVKVNGFCDRGIQSLVLALNEIDGVVTLDSCERGVYGEAYVFFTLGNVDWTEQVACWLWLHAEDGMVW